MGWTIAWGTAKIYIVTICTKAILCSRNYFDVQFNKGSSCCDAKKFSAVELCIILRKRKGKSPYNTDTPTYTMVQLVRFISVFSCVNALSKQAIITLMDTHG